MSAVLVLAFLAATAVALVLAHQDGLGVGRERGYHERRRREADKARRHSDLTSS